MFGLKRLICVSLLLLLGISGSPVPTTQSFSVGGESHPQPWTSTIQFSDWFWRMYNESRENEYSMLNRSGWYTYGWNFTSEHYSQAHDRPSTLLSTLLAYINSGDDRWFAELVWTLDNWLQHESQLAANPDKPYAYNLYERMPNAEIGRGWVQWMSMYYLSKYKGFNYDVDTRVNYFMSKAAVDNSTHLVWMRYWHDPYSLGEYTVNTIAPIMWFLSFMHTYGYGNYTGKMKRLYTALEEARDANGEYMYKLTQPETKPKRYTLRTILELLIAKKINSTDCPVNMTKIQETLDVFTYSDFDSGGEHFDRVIGVAVAIAASQFSEITLPDVFKRLLQWGYDNTYNHYSEFYWADDGFHLSRHYQDWWTDRVLFALGWFYDGSIAFDPPQIQQETTGSYEYYYMKTRFDNGTFIRASTGGWFVLDTPAIDKRINYSPIDVNSSLTYAFNETTNEWRWFANFSYGGNYYPFYLYNDKYSFGQRFQAVSNKINWRILNTGAWGTYVWRFVFPNGTVLNIEEANTTHIVGTAFAIERQLGRDRQWYLWKTDNSTLEQYTAGNETYLRADYANWTQFNIVDYYVDNSGASDLNHSRQYVAQSLTRMLNDQTPTIPEKYAPRTTEEQNIWKKTHTFGRIIHSDANISNYNDQIASQSNLSLSLTYETGHTSTTVVYVGDEGKPTNVSGAISWSYNNKTKIVTIDVFHNSSEEIVVYFPRPRLVGDVNEDNLINVVDLTIVSLSYGYFIGEPGYNPAADINKDGIVDMQDLVTVALHLGETT